MEACLQSLILSLKSPVKLGKSFFLNKYILFFLQEYIAVSLNV